MVRPGAVRLLQMRQQRRPLAAKHAAQSAAEVSGRVEDTPMKFVPSNLGSLPNARCVRACAIRAGWAALHSPAGRP